MNKPIPFGKYYLLERINVGGMAEVFKAKAFGVEGFERLLAVKRILPNIAEDEEFITMFIDEAKIAVQLQHANIAQIFDLGKVDDAYFIALEYVYGKDLRAIFDHLRKLDVHMPIAQICYVLMQVCEGLDYAHNKRDSQGRELNLVHRDVSPQNVLVGYEGEVKLVDFGIAKAAGKASKTQAGILKGKFGYMSPEQVRGLPVDRRSDIFSVGICLYELLTNERLFVGESDFSTLEKVRNVEILPPTSFNREIPAELERIVLKALAKDVDDRYQNAIDLHDDLQAFLYSLGELYSRKDLASWMKKSFGGDLEEEQAKLESYRHFTEPTPAPSSGGSASRQSRPASAAKRGGAAQGLDWDEEELETQIFDKAPETSAATPSGMNDDDEGLSEDELTSNDLYVGESQPHGLGDYDDRTVAGPPPDELLGEMGLQSAAPAPAPSAFASAPARPSQTMGVARPTGGGPPPGLGAYRNGSGNGLSSTDLFPQLPQHPGSAPLTAFSPGAGVGRQTLVGMPHAQPMPGYAPQPMPMPGSSYPPGGAIPERQPLSFAQKKGGGGAGKLIAGVVVAAVLIGAVAWWRTSRPGKLHFQVKPENAEIFIDGAKVDGPTTIERAPGVYNILVKREGYDEKSQTVEVEAGGARTVDIQLQASSLTGFELTSDPPSGLVWLDGEAFKGGTGGGQQVRTNFKAYRVTPGRHVLEIKGDPRFKDWKYEFFQDPGKMMKINAALEPAGGAEKPAEAAPAAAAKPVAPVAPKPVAAAPVPPAPKPTPAPLPPAPKPVAVAPTPPAPKPAPAPRPAPAPPVVHKVAQTTKTTPPVVKEPAAAPAEASGGECTVTLGSKPWSEVWVDGKNTGKITPLVDFKVPCGKHKITFKNPDLKLEKSETITAKAGEKFKKVFQLVDTEE